MNKKILLIALFLLIIITFLFIKIFWNNNSYALDNENSIIKYSNKIAYVKYEELNSLLNDINNYIYYNNSIDYIYNDIIDKYYNLKRLKMYEENNNMILEIELDENDSKLLLNRQENTTLKIAFDDIDRVKSIDLNELNYKLNKEKILRESIVKTASMELGKTGETYWTWYGFNHRVEWCAVFVSWVFNENGLLNKKVPKFIWVKKGVDYFKDKNSLKYPSEYNPKPGDIIFFDWNNNLVIDHVGIVEKVDSKYVYSIEGNVDRKDVQRRKSNINSHYIYAYGVPDYEN